MPTYQYACTACDERLEVVQKFSDEPLTECPNCQGRLRKVFSAVGVVFKGSGFYKTDSRASTGAGKAKSEAGGDGAATTGSGSEAKSGSDAKPAAKTETTGATKEKSATAGSSKVA